MTEIKLLLYFVRFVGFVVVLNIILIVTVVIAVTTTYYWLTIKS